MSTGGSTVRALSCPNCGGTIALRAAGASVSLVCEHCGSTLDATRPDLAVIVSANAAMHRPEIPLGTRGELAGTMWEAIGYLERDDGETGWREYLLFNPYEGYAFLIDDGRRFSLGRLIDRLPGHGGGALTLDGQGYTRFGTSYGAWVRFVVGEFYWRVTEGEHAVLTDFVRPGAMLSCEEVDGERTWTRTVLLDRGVAEAAFGLDPRPRAFAATPAPHQPSPYREPMLNALIIGLVAAATLIVIAIMGSGGSRVGATTLAVSLDAPTVTAVAGPLELPDRSAAVRIRAVARDLDNSWIDLDYSLVDRRTQRSFDAYALAERYRGRDSEGNWSEGDRSPTIRLSSIPAGSYDLVVEATAHRWQMAQETPQLSFDIPVEITVDRGGIFAGNVILGLFLILLWPVALVVLHLHFEQRRMAPVA